jgi:hypothetical protein
MADPRRGLSGFPAEARAWVRAVHGRVPSYARLVDEVLPLLERSAEVRGALEEVWRERSFAASYHRPLLLFAALRAEALAEGATHPLWEAIAREPPRPAAVTTTAVASAMAPARRDLYARLARQSVQTNETSRAVAWLWPAHFVGAGEGGRPLALVDIGASAGLNLIADRLPPLWTDPAGAQLPVARAPATVLRLGFDRDPLDVRDDAAVAWLEACVWPGEPHRGDRLRAAVAAMRAAHATASPPRLVPAEAPVIPQLIEAHTRALPPGAVIIAYQTVFIEYLGSAAAPYLAGMRRWLTATPNALWVELELADKPSREYPALMRATVRDPAGRLRTVPLARCGYHPTVVEAVEPAVAEVRAALAP